MQKKTKALLIIGKGNTDWDHYFPGKPIQDLLADMADVKIAQDLSELNKENLSGYDVIINYSLFLEPTESQFDALFDFVRQGGAYYGLHTATVTFLNSPLYPEMIGGRFVCHDDIKTFTVKPYDDWWGQTGERHPVTEGVEEFRILDELYINEGDQRENRVIARAEGHPIMWWKPWGQGKVMYLALGHEEYSIQNEGFKTLFRNGYKWLVEKL